MAWIRATDYNHTHAEEANTGRATKKSSAASSWRVPSYTYPQNTSPLFPALGANNLR